MKLSDVKITNYRSIREASIDFDPRCRVLVGINEAGKSNVLRGLALLSTSEPIVKDDARLPLPSEPLVKESWVDFNFNFDSSEMEIFADAAEKKVYSENPNTHIIKHGKDALTPRQFFLSRKKGLYRINILTPIRFATYWTLPPEYRLAPGWKTPTAECPANGFIPGTTTPFKNFSTVFLNDYSTVPAGWLRDTTVEEVNDIIGAQLKAHVQGNLPEIVYWTYNDKNLLPAQIPTDQFQTNPNTCIPLMNMFGLAGIENITKVMAEERPNPHRFRNLLNRVADRATKHLNEAWSETRGIEIHLASSGNFIEASIKDKANHYGFSLRSDGFKRFITFLLMISARVRTKNMQDAILVIDEPEIGLHPKGARLLMDELIKISATNTVIYCTHSIFMIDRKMVGRHLIVTKDREVTTLAVAGPSNFIDEEVLYRALGHTTFDSLERNNLVFEGWRDKKLFKTALPKLPKPVRAKLSALGICHAEGVSDARKISQMLELANKFAFIISDSDSPARKAQQEFIEKKAHGRWLNYKDINPDDDAVTGEDFVKADAFSPVIEELRQRHSALPELTDTDLIQSSGKISALKKWLRVLPADEQNTAIQLIKTRVFSNLSVSDIEPRYFALLGKLVTIIGEKYENRLETISAS